MTAVARPSAPAPGDTARNECPAVTVVLATYNRPEALRAAIRSVLRQTRPDWRMLVIGDCCDSPTAAAVRSIPDPRIRYFNLPARFGEQGGPNSVGMALAETEFVALLNHDDVWLPDHLDRAIAALRRTGADVFMGRAALATKSIESDDGGKRPVFSEDTSRGLRPQHIYHVHGAIFEPVSSWVFATALARRVGPWTSYRRLYRTPLQDWLLRAWRAGARFAFRDAITVLNLLTHYQYPSGAGCYAAPSAEHLHVDALLDRLSPAAVRAIVEREVAAGNGARKPFRLFQSRNVFVKLLVAIAANRATAGLYRLTRVDLYSLLIPLARERRGRSMENASRLRTGTEAPRVEDFDALLAASIAAARNACDAG